MPISFSAAGLPAGLSINAQTGAIWGYPTASGNFRVILGATSPAGTGTLTLALAIGLPPMPVITSAANASGVANKMFDYRITATNNPTRFDATGLPSGLSINPYIGAISGYLLAGGTFTVRLSASNPGGTATKALTLFAVVLSTPVITSPGTAAGVVGKLFSYVIKASNNPEYYSVNNLPPGLSFDFTPKLPDTSIYGYPTKAGVCNVPLSASNVGGRGTKTLVITITNPPLPAITSAASASGKVGAAFNYAITASNSPTSFTAAGLPAGLSLNKTTGAISGKPTKAGTYSASLSAANAGGAGTQTLVITIK